MISTRDAARLLGVSDRRVRAMIRSGKLPATKVGWGWIIDEKDLAACKIDRRIKRRQ